MNFDYIIGKIISDINFEFIIESKDYSIAIFELQLSNGSTIEVKAYNELADYCYLKLHLNDVVFIEGSLRSNNVIVIEEIVYI